MAGWVSVGVGEGPVNGLLRFIMIGLALSGDLNSNMISDT